MGASSINVTNILVRWYCVSLLICSSVCGFEGLDIMSKTVVKKCASSSSDWGRSVKRTMLLTSASDSMTYLCSLLYVFEGSDIAGSIDWTKRVKMS